MHVLIIGGTRFMGPLLTRRLVAGGHRVTLLSRGTLENPFAQKPWADRVAHVRADRTGPEFARVLAGRDFDAAVDFAAYDAADARGVVDVLGRGRVGHYVMISTGQVYLVRSPRPAVAQEADYDGPLMAEPEAPGDRAEWAYGMGKRGCEDVLVQWAAELSATRLRIPVVLGARDYKRRLEAYLWRLVDGGPVLVPAGPEPLLRPIYAGEVARFIAGILGDGRTFGRAYNLAQDEAVRLGELLHLVAGMLGARGPGAARPLDIVRVAAADMVRAGLDVLAVSPLSGAWMSHLDPGLARREFGFAHAPLAAYLEKIVDSFVTHPPAEPPPGYAARAREIELCRSLSGDV